MLLTEDVVISVVIPTKDRVNEILKCIRSILKQSFLPHEIFIIDSSKNPLLYSMLRERFPFAISKIKYIHLKVSNNAARNIGIRRSSGDIVFFFDDDVVLDKNYIKEVVKVFAKDKGGKIGGVMGNITTTKRDTRSIRAKLKHLFYQSYYGDGKFRPSGAVTWVNGKKKNTRTEFLSGCSSAYTRKVLNEFKWDEKLGVLGGYCFSDDLDLSYRVSRKYILMYTPFAKLEHRPPTKVFSLEMKRQYVFNNFYLFKKNMPKHLSNIFAFIISVYGILLFTLLFERNLKGFIGCLQGIKDLSSKFPASSTELFT